ncbi:MAG: hypothetical protein QG575_101 [Euryarchaeota archaeon]|nr:hypothetical protein [Euryarchaeota archaeon]
MMLDTDLLCDKEKQWFISLSNILLIFSAYVSVKSPIQSLLHIIFIKSVSAGGKDDR